MWNGTVWTGDTSCILSCNKEHKEFGTILGGGAVGFLLLSVPRMLPFVRNQARVMGLGCNSAEGMTADDYYSAR